jgi:histidine triad (HIT) family protein
MKDCIFCKIASGEIEDLRIWEDEKYVAFLDINPFILGHTLVIPKKHSRWLWDMGEVEYVEYLLAVRKVAAILKKAFNTDCIQQFLVGMEIPHTHIHLLPRTKDDGFSEFPKKPLEPKPSEKEMKEIAEKIKKSIQ